MPSNTLGFTGDEIVDRAIKFIGNTRSDFQTYLENSLPLAEFRYCKMHDWRFLHKQNLPLPVVNGTTEYALTTSNIGFYMAAEDVESIFDSTNGRYLKKTTLQDIRRFDPKSDDGSATDEITHWAPLGDNRILLYPPQFEAVTLRVDGKVTPTALTTTANYPTIPFRFQEGFIEYVIAIGLSREDDERAQAKKSEAVALIMEDIKSDTRSLGDTSNPRLRSMSEAAVDGASGNAVQHYLNSLFQ